MDTRAEQLKRDGNFLFSKKAPFNSLLQEIADNFYPERADFTIKRSLGREFADNLMTSFPVLCRRDLGDAFTSMLRRDKWFDIGLKNQDTDHDGKIWLQYARDTQYAAMYARGTQFQRSAKEGDHDFAAFGQCVISIELNKNANGLLYRCWHIRDVAWAEGPDGEIDTIHRKWRPTARDLIKLFPKGVSEQVKLLAKDDPYREVECRHVIIPAEDYDGEKYKKPFVSVYIDIENDHIMEEVGVNNKMYCIPRWQTVSGSQYAYSPATIIGLPDARLIQSMTRIILEAGEKAVDPPLVASKSAFRDDFNLMSGGITWADIDADQDIKSVIGEFTKSANLPAGLNMSEQVQQLLTRAFYLDSLTLPQTSGMTAYEISQRVQQYIRQALPLFNPVESEYNGQLCEMTFDLLMQSGAFGSKYDIPKSLQGQDIQFEFVSPLQSAIGQEKQGQLQATAEMLQMAMNVDQSAVADVDIRTAFRDALEGFGVPEIWIRDREVADQMIQQQQQQVQDQQTLAQVQQGAQTLQQVSQAAQNFSGQQAQ